MYQKILIATDGSTLSNKAVGNGLALANSLGADLVVLKVVRRYTSSYFEGGYVMPLDVLATPTLPKWCQARNLTA